MAEKATHVIKELIISFIGLVIALIFSALALGIANWGIGFFGITGDVAKGAAIIAVAIVIGPTIAAFATKKYFQTSKLNNPFSPFFQHPVYFKFFQVLYQKHENMSTHKPQKTKRKSNLKKQNSLDKDKSSSECLQN